MTDHLVLIFAYSYPPENAVGAARPYRFAKYLARLGYTCRVFTAVDQAGSEDSNTEYVPDPFVVSPGSGFGWQAERAIRKIFLPGELGTRWSYPASRAAREFVRAHPGAHVTLFSTSPPLGPHLAAWQLARSEGLPWIADFRDPFPDGCGGNAIPLLQKQAYRWLERSIARKAGAVIANTDGALVQWREKFPSLSGKIRLIWNGFDSEKHIGPLPVSSDACRVLSHAGELYGGRNGTPILESIARLLAAGRLPAGSVRVRLIGPADAGALPNDEFLARARAEGWLDLVNERISQSEALQIARSSDGLLLLQPQSTSQVPGKLFEYLQIGRPILAFLQPNSPSERILAQSGVPHRCVYPGEPSVDTDAAVAEFFSMPSTPAAASPWFEKEFNTENQTRQLDAIIRSLHEKAAPDGSHSPGSFVGGKSENEAVELIDRR